MYRPMTHEDKKALQLKGAFCPLQYVAKATTPDEALFRVKHVSRGLTLEDAWERSIIIRYAVFRRSLYQYNANPFLLTEKEPASNEDWIIFRMADMKWNDGRWPHKWTSVPFITTQYFNDI